MIKDEPPTTINVDAKPIKVSENCEATLLKQCTYGDITTNKIESANIQIYTKLIEELLGKGSEGEGEGAESNQSLAHKDYLHLIHQALFYSVETYYSISAIVHVVFILQNKDEAINVKFNKVGKGGEGGGAADADAIKKMKIMLAISTIEQFAFILHYLKDYSEANNNKFIKKTAKYVARLCHAHDLIIVENEANLKKLLGIDVSEEDRKGINKKDLLEVGEYQNIIDKHKDGKEITLAKDPYDLLKTSVTEFIKAMYDKVTDCLTNAEVVAKK